MKEHYNAGYRKIPEDSVVLSREEYDSLRLQIQQAHNKGVRIGFDLTKFKENSIAIARKETAKEILDMLYDIGVNKEILECCRIYDVNGVDLAKQICEKYGVEIEE